MTHLLVATIPVFSQLEAVMKHHDEQIRAGKRSWYSALFGRK